MKRHTALYTILVAAICILGIGWWKSQSHPAPDPPPVVPMKHSVANGQITIESGKWASYTIEVKPEMIDPTLRGQFTASGGSGDDVLAAVGDEMNITNWINGHAATMVWQTPGQLTVGKFEIKLQPGVYYFVISNKFSVLTDKQVTVDANLFYGQRSPAASQ